MKFKGRGTAEENRKKTLMGAVGVTAYIWVGIFLNTSQKCMSQLILWDDTMKQQKQH
jgi:hypothetical protein